MVGKGKSQTMARYGFAKRLQDYMIAEAMDDKVAGGKLPISPWGKQRVSRLGGRERAREFRLAVSDQAAEVRKTIRENRPQPILAVDVELLLKLLGEYDEAE